LENFLASFTKHNSSIHIAVSDAKRSCIEKVFVIIKMHLLLCFLWLASSCFRHIYFLCWIFTLIIRDFLSLSFPTWNLLFPQILPTVDSFSSHTTLLHAFLHVNVSFFVVQCKYFNISYIISLNSLVKCVVCFQELESRLWNKSACACMCILP